MRCTFTKNEKHISACTGQAGMCFALSQQPMYQNREFRCWKDWFLFDGYSHWFRGSAPLSETEAFTLSVAFLPVTFSAHPDGLFSCYRQLKGLELLVNKGGRLTVRLGLGRFPVEFSSLRAHAQAGVCNVVTVVFRGAEGWCDLYVNGVFSNRKQFPRHTRLIFPETLPYIGRRVDGEWLTEDKPFSCFYGFMKWVELDTEPKTEEEILALHGEIYTGQQEEAAFLEGLPCRSAYLGDRNRPSYHLIPPGKWMNEPHGPLYYKGWYHIFYQGNPHAPIWDHLCWGHLRSRDMIRWQDCPPALIPEKEPLAPDGCWSGSSVVDKEGKPRIYYTAGDDGRFPNQAVALAVPEDCTDEALMRWRTHPELIKEQDMGWMGEFRDPFVWLEKDTYYMLVGSGDAHNGGGNAILYSSADGLDWQNHGFLVDYDYARNTEVGHVWELPVLLPLRDETGAVACHILLLCAAQIEGEIVETYYFLGSWNEAEKKFEKFHEKARLLDLGKGFFTGPSGFVTPDGRSVVFTIAQGRRSFPEKIQTGWAHNGDLPVELSMREGALHIQPVREVESLRQQEIPLTSAQALAQHPGDALCLDYTAAGDAAAVVLRFGSRCREVWYDRTAKRLGVRDETGAEIGRWRCHEDDVDIGGEDIHFLCYLDGSMLEVYLNGRKAVTLRNYTEEERRFEVIGTPRQLHLWEMESAYLEEKR